MRIEQKPKGRSVSDMDRAQELVELTMKATADLCTDAVRKAEAEGNKTFFVVIDGSRLAECTQVLPHGNEAKELVYDAFQTWVKEVDEELLKLRVPSEDGSGDWCFSWEDEGELTAYHPSYV
jgi:hypothetical protein